MESSFLFLLTDLSEYTRKVTDWTGGPARVWSGAGSCWYLSSSPRSGMPLSFKGHPFHMFSWWLTLVCSHTPRIALLSALSSRGRSQMSEGPHQPNSVSGMA